MTFRLSAHHFAFRALESVYFPTGKAGNVLRGALGSTCDFEPPTPIGPSGFEDPPRPFVIRAAHLDGKRFAPGERFGFDVHLFGLRNGLQDRFEQSFLEFTRTGLGPRRGKVEIAEPVRRTHVELDLARGADRAERIIVRFHTPTELKGPTSRGEAPFGVLAARIRDRISTLRGIYGEGPLPIDFKPFSERAGLVRTVRCDLRYRDISRRSSRTGHVHGIGGFTGTAEYEGELTEFLPWLRAAWWTGVGRHTAWGNGVIEVGVIE